jgi:hypothetical protein
VYEQYWAVKGRIEKYRFAREKGIEAIVERQPGWIFEKLRDELPSFWEADSQALVHIRRGAYGVVGPGAALAATALLLLPYLALLPLLVIGLAAMPMTRGPLLLVGFLAYYTLLHVATHGYARYRLPVMPVVFLLGALGAHTLSAGRPAKMSPGRRVTVATVALTLLLSLLPSLHLLADHRALGRPDPGDHVPEETTDQ